MELKKTYDAGEWRSVYPKIIFSLENQKKTYQNIYTRILIEEGEKQKLLAYVKTRPSTVESFYEQLIPEFKEEFMLCFCNILSKQLPGRVTGKTIREYAPLSAI